MNEHESIKGMLWEGRIDEVAALRRGVVKRLVVALGDKRVNDLAACALAKIAGKTPIPEAINPLINALENGNRSLRLGAALALGAAGEQTDLPEVVAPLVKALEDEYSYVRSTAAWSLGNIAAKTKGLTKAVGPLIGATYDVDKPVRDDAKLSLDQIKLGDIAGFIEDSFAAAKRSKRPEELAELKKTYAKFYAERIAARKQSCKAFDMSGELMPVKIKPPGGKSGLYKQPRRVLA